ncbi:MAG: LptF/LptG family permease [Phycisphaerales bacterium]|nr:LptF/LptG family permease [Phycisphaerales bacterium]
MKKIDWYILKKFLSTFFFSIFLFTLIAVIIDASEKADDFVKSKLSFIELINQYFIGFIPYIVALLFPIFVLISVIFFTSKMASQCEIVPILASGVSFSRFLRPYWVGGIFLATILLIANQYIIPKANQIRVSFQAKYVDLNSSYNPLIPHVTDYYLRIDSFTYAGIHSFDTFSKRGNTFFLYTLANGRAIENIRATTAKWNSSTDLWDLQDVLIRDIAPTHQTLTLTPLYALKKKFSPQEFINDEYKKDRLTTPELIDFIKNARSKNIEGINTYQMELYRRTTSALSVLLLSLMGAIIASKKVRGGSGMHLAVGFLLGAAYIIFDKFSTIFSTKGNLSPLVASWIPNCLFIVVTIYLYKKAPK